jgi:hypothetical protein
MSRLSCSEEHQFSDSLKLYLVTIRRTFRMDNSTKIENFKFDCVNGAPYFFDFMYGLVGAKSLVLIVPMVICAIILWLFSRRLKTLISDCPVNIRPNCISLISIYPIVSISSVLAIAVPRAYFFMDTIGHVAFMIISYQLYRYINILLSQNVTTEKLNFPDFV